MATFLGWLATTNNRTTMRELAENINYILEDYEGKVVAIDVYDEVYEESGLVFATGTVPQREAEAFFSAALESSVQGGDSDSSTLHVSVLEEEDEEF